jgi:hypothetical protein
LSFVLVVFCVVLWLFSPKFLIGDTKRCSINIKGYFTALQRLYNNTLYLHGYNDHYNYILLFLSESLDR